MTEHQGETIVKVSRENVEAARALIRLCGGEDKVDPVVVKIAHAERAPIWRAPAETAS